MQYQNVAELCKRVKALWNVVNGYEVESKDDLEWLLKLYMPVLVTTPNPRRSVIQHLDGTYSTSKYYNPGSRYCITEGGAMLLERVADIKLPHQEITVQWS